MTPSLDQIADDFHAFIASFQSVILATVDQTATPDASYAPILQQNGRYYIFISELAQHTANLMNTPTASLLFIEPEEDAKQLFARKRASIQVSAQQLDREHADWTVLLDAMNNQLGGMITVLRDLADFHLFELTPIKANFVTGFGQAYQLTGDQLQTVGHRNGKGHRSSKTA